MKATLKRITWSGLAWLSTPLLAGLHDVAYAGNQAVGNITKLATNPPVSGYPAVFFFSADGTRNSTPACATIEGRWAMDGSAAGGQQAVAL